MQEAAEAQESEEKAYAKETKDKYANLFGSVDSSDDEIQQRKTADQRRLETENQETTSGFGMQQMGMMFKAMMESQAKTNRDMLAEFAKLVSPDPNKAHQPRQEDRAQSNQSRISENKLDLRNFARIKEFEGGEENFR